MKTMIVMMVLGGMMAAGVVQMAQAVDGNWISDGNGNWSDATKWSSDPDVPGTAAGDEISLNHDITGGRTVTIDATSRTNGTLNIGDSNNTHGFVLNANGGASLTFANNGNGAALNEVGSVADTINAPIILDDNLAASIGGALTLGGSITTAAGKTLTQSGTGTLTISGNNTHSANISSTNGLILSTAGTSTFNGNMALSGGTLKINATGTTLAGSGLLTLSGGATISVPNSGTGTTIDMDQHWDGNIASTLVSASGQTITFNGPVTLGTNVQVANKATIIVNGAIGEVGGSRNLTLTNNGGINTFILNGINTYSGTTTLNQGTLILNGTLTGGNAISVNGSSVLNQSATGVISGAASLSHNSTGSSSLAGANNYSGLTTVSNGTLTVTAPSTMGALTIAAGKSFIYAPTTAGALTVGGDYTLDSATTLNAALGGSLSQSAIISSGTASLAGTGVVNVRLIPGVPPAVGTHNLITAASGLDGGTYTLGKVYNNTDLILSNFARTATAISVSVGSATPLSGNVYWKGGLPGATAVWSASDGTDSSNWQVTDGVNQPLVPSAASDLVFSTATSPGTMAGMTLGNNMTVRSLTITNTATAFSLNADTLGSSLTITPSSSSTGITIGTGVLASSIAAPIALGADQTWANHSANDFTVSGAISGSGSLVKSGAGTLILLNTANSYTGSTIVTGGILQCGTGWTSRDSLPGGYVVGVPTTGSNLELNGGTFTTYGQFHRMLGAGPGAFQITGGASGFNTRQADSWGEVSFSNNVNFEVVWGSDYFKPDVFVMNEQAAAPIQIVNLLNKIDLNGADRTIACNSTSSITPVLNNGNMTNAGGRVTGVIRNSGETPAGIIKIGPGWLQLTAVNTYDGDTYVEEGTLDLAASSTLNDDTSLRVSAGAMVNLRTGVNETVKSLYFDNKPVTVGTWGSGLSAADNTDDTYFSGDGILTVLHMEPPSGTVLIVR